MSEKLYIARDHVAHMSILLREDASGPEKFAASELRHYLELITGATFDLSDSRVGRSFVIGCADDTKLGDDGFTIATDGGDVSITGGKRGVIYGVYEYLERLGCRFFTVSCEKVPVNEVLELSDINDTQVPVLEYREHNYTDAVHSQRFSVKCRLNGAHHKISDRLGGYLSYAWYVHTFDLLVPPELYAAEHPEYYALIDGEHPTPYGGRYQLCLANPDVLEISVESVRRALHEHPEASIISVSQNDWLGNCTCDACTKIDREEGSPAGTLLRFVNAIAERLEPEFPDMLFDTLAYNYSRPAPAITRPRHNVCVRLCSIECCFTHPFESCDDGERAVTRPDGSKSSFIDDLRDWGKICNRMYIWDYTTCFAHYPTPHPNWRTLKPNMQAFIKNNVKGVFEQANGAFGGGVDLNELRLYLISKLLWNADADIDTHMNEFLDFYYGDAAPYIHMYIDTLCDKVEADNIHVGFNDHPVHGFLTEDMLDIYDSIFDSAQDAVAGDPQRLWRVAKARLAIRYVRIKARAMRDGTHDTGEINSFFTDWRGFGLTRIDEWVNLETTHRALLRDVWRGVEFFEHWGDEGGEVV